MHHGQREERPSMRENAAGEPETPDSSLVRSIRKAVEQFRSTEHDQPLVAVYLYGSTVRGRVTALSDLDLAVLFQQDVSEDRRWQVLPRLGSAVARRLADGDGEGLEVDVHDLASLSLAVQGRVLTEGVLVLSVDEVPRVRFEDRTRRRYFDFLPFQQRDTEEGLRGLRERVDGG